MVSRPGQTDKWLQFFFFGIISLGISGYSSIKQKWKAILPEGSAKTFGGLAG